MSVTWRCEKAVEIVDCECDALMRCVRACLHGRSSLAKSCRGGWPTSPASPLCVPTLQIQSAWQPLCCCLVPFPKRALSAPLTDSRLESP